jgi:hypothetical protein
MGRDHGHSCPKEIHGQKKHRIIKKLIYIENSGTGCAGAAGRPGTGRRENTTRYGQI